MITGHPEDAEFGHRQTFALLRRAVRYVAPFRRRFAVKLGLGAVSLLPMLLLPWPVKLLVDHVIEGIPIGASADRLPAFVRPVFVALEGASPIELVIAAVGFQAVLLVLVGAIGSASRENDQTDAYLSGGHDTATTTENEANSGFSLAGGLLGYLDFRWTVRLTQALNHHYRSRLFERIQSLPMSAIDDERIGDAIYRVMYDTPAITGGVYRILLTPVLSTLLILLAVLMLEAVFGGDPVIVWTGLSLLPLSALASAPFAAWLRRQSTRSRTSGATTTATVEEGMANILAVQGLGGSERERARFESDSWQSFGEYRGIVRISILTFLAVTIPAVFLIARAFLHAVDLVIAGTISVGDFVLFIGYFGLIAAAAIEIGVMWIRLQTASTGLQRVFFLMDLPADRDPPGARPIADVTRGVHLEGVAFHYPDGTPAVQGVDLEARVGQVTALVGPAGAGKTTLAYLLCGYLQPSEGLVLVDGIDAASIQRASLRARIAFVFQETALFDETVEDNIRVGRPDAPETDVRRAARRAGAERFIEQLPEGYRTRLGRGGGKLSAGQKQRLAIARALVRDAPILVLDEPTSALDPETERDLVAALRAASRDRLVLVIAHRLSTVRAADHIFFVEAGRIVERGSHDELMARPDSPYRRYVELQTRGAA